VRALQTEGGRKKPRASWKICGLPGDTLTAFLPDPAEAIAQVAHDLGVLAETLGWTRPGWIEAATQFSPKTWTTAVQREPVETVPATTTVIATVTPGRAGKGEETPDALSLAVRNTHRP
jgi:hypothetical protein